MYEIMKRIISNEEYELRGMLLRIEMMYAGGRISLDEMEELEMMARKNAKSENSYATMQEQVNKAFEMIAMMQKQIDEIKGITSSDEGETTDEWTQWTQPTGAHDAYYAGMKMIYMDGKRYTCIAPEGVACVWGPDVMPGYWMEEE